MKLASGGPLRIIVSITVASCLTTEFAQIDPSRVAREQSILAIKKLGGDIVDNEDVPPGIEVSLTGPTVSDADLNCLTSLTDLVWLDLSGAGLSDAGISNLKGLKRLRRLDLSNTAITGRDLGILRLWIN